MVEQPVQPQIALLAVMPLQEHNERQQSDGVAVDREVEEDGIGRALAVADSLIALQGMRDMSHLLVPKVIALIVSSICVHHGKTVAAALENACERYGSIATD